MNGLIIQHILLWQLSNLNEKKNISVYETSKKVAQIKTISKILTEIYCDNNKSRTAIILPQSEMLRPLLNSIPKNIPQVNVSMSVSLIDLELPELTLSFLNVYVSLKYNRFYHKDIINFCQITCFY